MRRSDPPLDNVRPLHRVRVLVASGDQRFVRVAGFLLERNGFLVTAVHNVDHMLGAVDRHAPHVVVLDGSDSLAASSRSAAAIEALHAGVRVIVVAENGNESEPGDGAPSDFPKSSSMAGLAAEVGRSYLGLESR